LSASAVERTNGDFYTYSLETELEGVQVTGAITYSFEGTDTISVEGEEFEVNVMSISGELEGGVLMITLMTANVGGTAYETRDGAAQVKTNVVFFANSTLGTGQFALVRTLVIEISSSYSPPILSDFDPSSTSPGDEWSETVKTTVTNSTWLNGDLWGDPVTRNLTLEYFISVASATEDITTQAGTFECLRIEATNESGDSMVYWWSSEVGNFVRVHTFSEGDTRPRETLELTDYRHEEPINTLLIVAIGGLVLFVAIVLLALVLSMMRRKPEEPKAIEPPGNIPPGEP
jgi:hypothetical protein